VKVEQGKLVSSIPAVPPWEAALSLIARLAVGGVLIYSGASKAVSPTAEFAAALTAYKILPHGIVNSVAMTWPWAELLVGTYVFFGFYTRLFAATAVAMFGVFLTVLVSAMLRGIDPGSCGCFGIGLTMSIHKTAAMDSVLLILSFLLFRLARKTLPASIDHWIHA
jgi:uncharacterized membrane protein YphA (DoxX/SURF4 family)